MADLASRTIGVVIIDDHQMFGQSLARLLDLEKQIKVLGIGTTGVDAFRLVETHRPRVLLIDFALQAEDGVTIAEQIKEQWPDTMIVMITGSADDSTLLSAVEAGCSGYLTKDRAAADVAKAVRMAAAGEALIPPAQLARLLPKLRRSYRPAGDSLTERERQVLTMLAQGSSNKVIASELFLSVNTIRNYTQSILAKLGAHSKLEAVAIAAREGLVEVGAETVSR